MNGRSAGFTLIEVTVVLVIIGILAGFAVLSLGNRSQDSRFEAEAKRLQQLIGLAAEEAETQGLELGLRFDDRQYSFLTLAADGKWVTLEGRNSLRARTLPEPFFLDLSVEGRAVKLARSGDDELKPQILLLSSGEATAFRLELHAPKQKAYYQLQGDALGKLTLERKENETPAQT